MSFPAKYGFFTSFHHGFAHDFPMMFLLKLPFLGEFQLPGCLKDASTRGEAMVGGPQSRQRKLGIHYEL